MSVRREVECIQCGKVVVRVVWSYRRSEPITMFFCGKSCKGVWQRARRESLGYDREWLFDQYHRQGKSANQIAREIGRDSKRVWEWMKDYGIETRPRGTDYGQNFQPGQESAFKGKRHTKESRERFRQARMVDGHVPYLKDGKHWLHHDGAKPASWMGGITPERQSFYATKEWKEAVKHVWSRDNATCQRCGKDHNGSRNEGAFHIHHIVSFMVRELRSNPNNLVLLCKECHRFVHSSENTEKEYIREIQNEDGWKGC